MKRESPLKDKVILVVDDEPDVLEMVAEELDVALVHKAGDYETALQYLLSYTYDVVILDEIGVAVAYEILPVETILNLIDKEPEKVELILTGGPKMHPKIKQRADLVTEMRMIKHYYSSQVNIFKGIYHIFSYGIIKTRTCNSNFRTR